MLPAVYVSMQSSGYLRYFLILHLAPTLSSVLLQLVLPGKPVWHHFAV